MKINSLILFFLSATILLSCNKKIKSEKGGIDIISNIYFNASKSLDEVQHIHVSKLNYKGDTILEIIPDLAIPEISEQVYLIIDTLCYQIGSPEIAKTTTFKDAIKTRKRINVKNKIEGAIFLDEVIPNYSHRRLISDTTIFKKNYKRFEINSPDSYTRFYVYPTDTILPYSLYKHADKEYKGRIERIDSYNKKKDIFVSLQLLPRKNWDSEAKDYFDFNQFANRKK